MIRGALSGLLVGTMRRRGASFGPGSGVGGGLSAALDLNFAAMTVLDPRVTYSGASLATLTDATGAIAYKPHNFCAWSEQFNRAGWTTTNQTVALSSGAAPDGSSNANRITAAAGSSSKQTYWTSASPTTVTTNSVYAKAGTASWLALALDVQGVTDGAFFNLSNGTVGTVAGGTTASISPVGNGWYRCSVTRTYSSANHSLTVEVHNADAQATTWTAAGTETILVWGAQANQGPLQSYYPTNGAIYFGPRFTYDPITHAALGLLIEEQRTNLLLQSNSLSTTWSAFGSAGISQNITGIDGGTTGWTLTDSNAGGLAGVQQAVAVAATTYTLSAYVKKTTGAQASYPVINADNGSTRTCLATIDTSNGVATVWTAYTGWTVTASSATCVSHNADYWRVTLTFLATAVNWNIGLYAAGTANATQSTGVLSASAQGSAGFTCLQLEAGAFATTYIPTTSASVTRAADSATMTGSNFSSWFNATQGTFAVEATPSNVNAVEEAIAVAMLNNNNFIGLGRNYGGGSPTGSVLWVNDSSVSQAYIVAGTVSVGTKYKVAASYAANAFAECVNSGTVGTDVSGTVPASLNTLKIGQTHNGIYANSAIARLRYYPVALTNAQLQALTT